MKSILERASAYLARMPVSVSGQGGHAAAFAAAIALTRGFNLTEEEALPLLASWNHGCLPPWAESELRHKLRSASASTGKPSGYLLGEDASPWGEPTAPDFESEPEKKARQRKAWPEFKPLKPAGITAIASLRRMLPDAVDLAHRCGFLKGAEIEGHRCFIIHEGTFAQARLLDGQPFTRTDGTRIKAKNLPGSEGAFIGQRWLGDAKHVLLVEGVIGLLEALAAFALVNMPESWSILAATSASSRFARDPALLARLRGRHVRLVPDADEAGLNAAASWLADLEAVGATADAFALPPWIQRPRRDHRRVRLPSGNPQRPLPMNATADLTASLRQRPACKPSIPTVPANEKHENNENSLASSPGFSCISSFSYGDGKPPSLPDSALYGPVGEIVRRILPHTEADPAALYAQLLVGLGNLIGPSPYFVADGSRHHANLFAIICGRTAKARKGTSWAQVKNVLEVVDEIWFSMRVKSGVVSGEGITQVFEGDTDKRLLLQEGEFAQVLQVMKREGNTVSVLLRQAWDGQKIAVLRRKDAIEVEGAHISLIGHITLPELRRLLASVEMSNGFANRCLWIHAERSKLLPEGGTAPDIAELVAGLNSAVNSAAKRGEVCRDEDAGVRWDKIYRDLSEPPPGRRGEILSRAEAQVMRLALLLALLDDAPAIATSHLDAALAFWRYCEASVGCIFAGTFSNPKAAKIWEALGNGPLTMTQIHGLWGNNASKAEIEAALVELAPMIAIEPTTAGGGKLIRRTITG